MVNGSANFLHGEGATVAPNATVRNAMHFQIWATDKDSLTVQAKGKSE